MFDVSKLKRQIRNIERSYSKDLKRLQKENAPPEKFEELEFSEISAIQGIEKEIDQIVGTRLAHKARSLDVETPPISDTEMWQRDQHGQRIWFTPKGRAYVRNLIHEESKRRFEAKSRWLPLLTVLLGIIGTITGLVAFLQQKKSADAAVIAAGNARINTELTKRHVEDADEAIVNTRLDYNEQDKIWNVHIFNAGRVSARGLDIAIEVWLTKLPSSERIRRLGTYRDSRDELRAAPDAISDMFESGLRNEELTAVQNGEMAVKLTGTITYDNGFGTAKHKEPCLVYVSEHVPECGALSTFVAGLKRQAK